MKPLISPHDVAISAANAPSESSDGSHAEVAPKVKKPRASRATTKKADGEVKPKATKKSTKAAAVEAPPPPEFGFFRCMCCDYNVTVLPGTEKPVGGLRCPYDFTKLHWVHS
jgi:hypothetical protein